MKNILIVLFISISGCCSPKKSYSDSTTGISKSQDNNEHVKNEILLPECINKMIAQFKSEEVQNPPRKIIRYLYNNNYVYYVTALCCDFYSDLYDNNCKLIAHPDGGFTGKGDGKAEDFIKTRTSEKLIWEDKRNR